MKDKILVTGGAGYIGSHAAKALKNAGWQPVILDNLDRGHAWAVRGLPFEQKDLSDRDDIVKILKHHQIKAVMHFAAHSQVGESVKKPELYFRNNVINTLKLLEAMHEAEVKTIVFSSTAATYGDPESPLIPETHPTRPINPYGESKLFIEKALHWYGESHGLKWAALRYFNAAGADPEGDLGEDHEPESHLIPLVLWTALGKRSCIDIYGTDYPTPDGTAVRDYIHVTDLSDAHIRALDYLANNGKSRAMNLGTGHGYSVREVIETAGKITGKKINFRETDRRAGDPPVLVADPSQAMQLLNWKPRYSELEIILSTAWKWTEKHFKT